MTCYPAFLPLFIKKDSRWLKTIIFSSLLFLMIFLISPFSHAIEQFDAQLDQRLRTKAVRGYDKMIQSRFIRALVPHSKTFYFLDGAKIRGASYEMLKKFEMQVNKKLSNPVLKVNIVIIPTPRDRLIPDLVAGYGDIALGNLTITQNRLDKIDFSDPLAKGVSEILITHASAGHIESPYDLSGRDVHVRKSSSYYESLVQLNKKLAGKGKPLVNIVAANEYLEDEDLIEMVNAGVIPHIFVDSHKANLWAKIFDDITLHPQIRIRENGRIGWAFRKNSPKLKSAVNTFIKNHKKGTLFGNIIFKRYLKNTKYIRHHYKGKDRERFEATAHLFKKYAQKFDFNWLMLAALAYQESGINQDKKSHRGAVGVMQILPSTATQKTINISEIHRIDPNIHAGTKYLRFIIDRYFSNPDIDQINRVLLGFAAYNAGPARIQKLRKKAANLDLNPNEWFNNVEITVAKDIGRETVTYVSNIFKYYLAYNYILNQDMAPASP